MTRKQIFRVARQLAMTILRSVVRIYSSANSLVVRKQTSCVVQLAKRLCFIVRMVNSPIRCKIRTMQTNTNPIFKSIRRCTVFKQEGHWSKLIVLRNACYKSVGDLKLSSKCRRQLKCFFPGKYFVQNNLIYRRL